MSNTANSTLVEHLRAIGAAHITLGQMYHTMAEQHERNLVTAGAAIAANSGPANPPAPAAANVAPPPPPAAAAPVAPPFPAAPAAPNAGVPPAPPADAKPPRVRRTKQQIADDEAALKAGYKSHADMLAATGGAAQAAVPAAPMAPGAAPVQAMSAMQQSQVPPAPPAGVAPPPPPPAAAPVDKGLEDLIASIQGVIGAVEAKWPGHGEGQAGYLLARLGHQNVHTVPAEQRDGTAQWFNYFRSEFLAGNANGGVSGWNPNGLPVLATA